MIISGDITNRSQPKWLRFKLFMALASACFLLLNPTLHAAEDTWTTPEGRYVMMQDYRLYFHCMGDGPVTLLFDVGIADTSANWLGIAKSVSDRARACLFDRAGNGMSDAGPSPRTTSTIVAEMDEVLEKAEINGPYILVGHSFGGYTMQYFASTHAAQIVGVVLVESSHPDQAQRLQDLDTIPGSERKSLIKPQTIDFEKLSLAQKYWSFLNSTRKGIYAQMEELRGFKESAEQVKSVLNFPDVPLAILTRGRAQLPSVEGKYSLETVWQDMQKELAGLSTQSWQVIVKDSGHSIHLEAPQVVVENISRILDGYHAMADNDSH